MSHVPQRTKQRHVTADGRRGRSACWASLMRRVHHSGRRSAVAEQCRAASIALVFGLAAAVAVAVGYLTYHHWLLPLAVRMMKVQVHLIGGGNQQQQQQTTDGRGIMPAVDVAEYLRFIPDVASWPEVLVGPPGAGAGAGAGGSSSGPRQMRVILDPRLQYLFSWSGDEWDRPVPVPSREDASGVFAADAAGPVPTSTMMMDMDSTRLIDHLRRKVLIPPPPPPQQQGDDHQDDNSYISYNLTDPGRLDPSEHNSTSTLILPIIESLRERSGRRILGRFFEAGALDGELSSRSLFLERQLGWTGLALEMTPPNARRFLAKRRRCWFAAACVSPEPRPARRHMRFAYDPHDPWTERTGTVSRAKWEAADAKMAAHRTYVYTLADCYPLYALLLAANLTRLDFLALDLEGVELQVLKTVPFDKVDISVISVEVFHTEEGRTEVENFLRSKGYRTYESPLADEHIRAKFGYFYDNMIFIRE